MIKKLQTISWGVWAAVVGVLVFVGIALLPDFFAATQTGSKKPKDSFMGMLAEADKKSREHKEEKKHQDEARGPKLEIKSIGVAADGTIFLGGKGGLIRVRNTEAADMDFPGREVKGLALAGQGTIYAAAKDGLWKMSSGSGRWEKIHEAEAEAVAAAPDGSVFLTTKRQGIQHSADQGKSWKPVAWTLPASAYEKKDHDDEKHKVKEAKESGATPLQTSQDRGSPPSIHPAVNAGTSPGAAERR